MPRFRKKPEIACSRCVDPGMCCRAFQLNEYFRYGVTPKEIMAWLRRSKLGFFRPLRRWQTFVSGGEHREQWQFRCTKLLANGRCGIYNERPNLCRSYEPGTDDMCVHVRGIGGKPIVPQKPVKR